MPSVSVIFIPRLECQPFPKTRGRITVDGLSAPVEIFRDRYGVPHVFGRNGIEVVVGASGLAPEALVRSYLDGTLRSGENVCDH